MSRLYDTYSLMKKTDENADNTLYLFKSGIFYIFLDNDARIASSLLNLKLAYLTETIVKCGFPINSLEKYKILLKNTPYKIRIVDTSQNISYSIADYSTDSSIKELLSEIASVNPDELSISEAYAFIEKINKASKSILGGTL